MARSIEHIVRPFVSGDVFSKSRLPPVTEPATVVIPDDVATSWEGSPDTDYATEDNIWYKTFESDLKEDKSKRVSRTVRVENEDDPDQHVFVERIDKSTFTDKNGKSLTLEFDWSSPKDGGT